MSTQIARNPEEITAEMIAPCGMNCAICIGFLRERNPCAGCLGDDEHKPRHCVICAIKNCPELENETEKYCFTCGKFPCARLRTLDKRYRARYGMSMVENLGNIRALGIEKFVANERKRWTCPECGSLISAHRDECLHCGHSRDKAGYS
jgi:ribosomal protein S27AE